MTIMTASMHSLGYHKQCLRNQCRICSDRAHPVNKSIVKLHLDYVQIAEMKYIFTMVLTSPLMKKRYIQPKFAISVFMK